MAQVRFGILYLFFFLSFSFKTAMKKRLALYISKEKKGKRSEKLLLNCRYRDPTLERITRRIRVFLNRFREKVYILPRTVFQKEIHCSLGTRVAREDLLTPSNVISAILPIHSQL